MEEFGFAINRRIINGSFYQGEKVLIIIIFLMFLWVSPVLADEFYHFEGADNLTFTNATFSPGIDGDEMILTGNGWAEAPSGIFENQSVFTYSALISPTQSGNLEILSKDKSTRELRLEGIKLRGCVRAGSNACSTSNEDISLTGWTSVVMTYSHPGVVRLYIDGTEATYSVQSVSSGMIRNDSATPWNIGRYSSGSRYFVGGLDRVFLVSRIWTNQEIMDEANLFPPPPPPPPPPLACTYQTMPNYPLSVWLTDTPENLCLDSVKISEAISIGQGAGGAGIIIRNGVMVGSWGDVDALQTSASYAKTGTAGLSSMLVMGESLWNLFDTAQSKYSAISSPTVLIEQLLSMTGGYDHNNCSQIYPEGDWAYSNCSQNFAADVMANLVGQNHSMSLEDYLRQKVYDVIGAISLTWDGTGGTVGGYTQIEGAVGMNVSVDHAARLAYLYLQSGMWESQRLLDPRILTRFSHVIHPKAVHQFPTDYIHNGNEPSGFYGLATWLNNGHIMSSDLIPADLRVGMGAFGCSNEFFSAWSPSTDIITVRAGNSLRSGGCNALHYDGNEDFLAPIFDGITGYGVD